MKRLHEYFLGKISGLKDCFCRLLSEPRNTYNPEYDVIKDREHYDAYMDDKRREERNRK